MTSGKTECTRRPGRDEERHALGEWDAEPYEMTDWRTAKVHPDHHIACQYALYSAPSATCPPGQKVEVPRQSWCASTTCQGTPGQGRGGRYDYPSRETPEQIVTTWPPHSSETLIENEVAGPANAAGASTDAPGRFARPGAVFARANGRTAHSAQGERS